ncbi:hypothetical protein KVQ82_12995 [Pseudomonas sp. AO-1]|uniref:hypothetical protein n=1 Tax=Pseudomonas sp. AO-1 TaxID=2855434 RepID=UPI001C792374|nr:hypothetical protein [Pseudomonas sp. AO-1]QXZ16777.1 hypothetical protein KVQ82_12995 [Pseudomonas sp. AO-1]
MDINRNLFATAPASADEAERLNIAKALENRNFLRQAFRAEEDFMQLATKVVSGSRFDGEHLAGKLLLRSLSKHPEFIEFIASFDLPAEHFFMVRSNGEVYAAYEEFGATGFYIHYTIITDELYEIESLRNDIELLSKTAWRSGGIISSSTTVPLRNWLAFQEIDPPENYADLANLIDYLNFKMPAPPKFANYWGISEETQDIALIVEPEQYPVIMQVVRTLMADSGRYSEPLINYLTDVLLKKRSGALLQENPRLAWEILMQTSEAKSLAQRCFDALLIEGKAHTVTEVTRSRLLLAAVVLDLDMGSDERVETHRSLRYESLYVHETPAQARTRLKSHFEQINRVSPFAAYLAVELVLAGQSPEFLVVTPPTLLIGSPGWVMLRKAVMLTERIAPGLSRKLSYEQLMKFAALAPLSDAQRALHQLLNLQCVLDWANINEVMLREDSALSEEQIATAAVSRYNTYAGELEAALKSITAAPVSRRKLAQQTLSDADIDHHQEVFRSPHNKGGLISDTVINLYLANQLHRKNLTSTSTKRNLHDVHPDLASLAPINQLYADKLKPQHETFKSGISTMIRLAFSRLGMSDREALTQGASTLYLVRGNRNIPGHSADHFSPHGVVILCRHKSKNHCFELFPLQGVCRKSERLAEAFASGYAFNEDTASFDGPTNGKTGNFPRLTYLENIITEHAAYFQGATPGQSEQTDINKLLPRRHWELAEHADVHEFGMLLDRLGQFAPHYEESAWYTSPMESYQSPRLKDIADFIAQKNPPITYNEYYRMGYDQTEYEEKQEAYERVANIILNIFIPFRGCIQQLTSDDPDKRSGAAFSCVIDALAVSFVFIGAAGALAKAVASSTRLLSLGRVAGSILVSIFNPVDGVPQVIVGAGKLAGKSALKLSHAGSSISMTAARQLRRLTTTSSGSYDLVKALSKSGAAAEIRMTLPTVAHARALFKDDTLESASQILTRLTDTKNPLPKTASPAELEHLFNKAVIDTTRRLQKAQELEALIGKTAIDELLATVLAKNGIDLQAARSAGKGYTDLLETVSEIEARKVNYMKGHQQNLLRQDLGKAPYNGVLPESQYNVQGFTDNAQRAGAWIVHASNSPGNDLASIVAVLREYANSNKALTDPDVIRQLHVSIAPATSDIVRVGVNDKKYASSISGFAVMQEHLKKLDTAHEHFSKQLLGTVVGFHGFGDGNGRTGRALYAISEIRKNRFNPLSKEAFSALHGLD